MDTQILVLAIVALVAAVACVFLVTNSKAARAREERQDQLQAAAVARSEDRAHERWKEERRAMREESLRPEFSRKDLDTLQSQMDSLNSRVVDLGNQLNAHLAQAKKVLESAQSAANQAGLALGARRFPPISREA